MPSRTPSRPTSAFHPPTDAATFRDLVLFEERLKSNAALLKRRKRRYQLFLAQLLAVLGFLAAEVFLRLDLLSAPYGALARAVLPGIYADPAAPLPPPRLHPAFASGLLTVAATTLVLFFASGMYTEKIGYANRYVPHANKALRGLNMYLNTRRPPLRARLPFPFLGMLFARPMPSSAPPSRPPSLPPSPDPSPPQSPLIPFDPSAPVTRTLPAPRPVRAPTAGGVPLAPIPPAQGARGELIFSARVPPQFRDAYVRYRAAFERARAGRERARLRRTWPGALWVWVADAVGLGDAAGAAAGGAAAGAGSAPGTPTPGVSRAPTPNRAGTPALGAPGSPGRDSGRGRLRPLPAEGGSELRSARTRGRSKSPGLPGPSREH